MPVRSEGERLVEILATLSNPHRLRILATLHDGRSWVSELARAVGISRPLVQAHLKRLERAGLVHSSMELTNDGKALNYYDITPFELRIDAASIAEAAKTLPVEAPLPPASRRKTSR